MFTLIENGAVLGPRPRGQTSLLLGAGTILKVGEIDRRVLDELGLPYEVITATGRLVTPGLIDPHEHLAGGSREKGFASQTPPIRLRELSAGGITTVAGCLGVDTTTLAMPALLARAKALREEGITAFLYTGGYALPPATLTGDAARDLLIVEEVIGAGEVAISDERSSEPSTSELARLVSTVHAAGTLSGKVGITHFHVGEGPGRLAPLREPLDRHNVRPEWLYPTHVERSEPLTEEAIDLARRGCTVDVDTVARDLPRWLGFYREHGGDPSQLTISSDAAISSPASLLDQLRRCVRDLRLPQSELLPLATTNTARVLGLADKGRLEAGADADVLILEDGSLEIVELIASGRRLVREGKVAVGERFARDSDRGL